MLPEISAMNGIVLDRKTLPVTVWEVVWCEYRSLRILDYF